MKLFERLASKLGAEHGENIYMALNDRKIENSIKKLMADGMIKLLNEKRQPVFQEQRAQAALHEQVDGEVVPYHKAISQHQIEGSIDVDPEIEAEESKQEVLISIPQQQQ